MILGAIPGSAFLGINAPTYLYQLMSASRETYLFHHLDTEKYRLLIDQILKMKGSAPEESFKGNGLLLQILGELFRDTKFDEQNWEKNCIADEIKFHLDMHYSDKLKRKEVARKFGVHPNYLTRIFREKYDIAPKQYLLHLKLEKACQLLRSTDLPVATIAGSMGFDDAMAFSKLFKKTYGCTPTHFRCAETAPL